MRSAQKITKSQANKFLILQLEQSGIQLKKSSTKNTKIHISAEHPLERLLENKIISKEEYHAGMQYFRDFELSNLSHHARPNWDDCLTISSIKFTGDKLIPQKQLDAAKRVYEAQRMILDASRPRQVGGFKKSSGQPKFSRDLQLLNILSVIFERWISVRNAEKILALNHNLIDERVKLICEILLKI